MKWSYLEALQSAALRCVSHRRFEAFVVCVILLNAAVIAMETYHFWWVRYGATLFLLNQIILGVFIAEIILKWAALGRRPWLYFKDPWNCFDFCVIALSLIPASGGMATLARLVRLLRVLRLVSIFPDLRLIVDTLVRTLPSMGHIALLLVLVFFVYGVAGHHLFSQVDPLHWQTLHLSMLTLFRIVTLEDWTDIMYAAMEERPWAWIYFVSFVILGTFVVVNLFIAVVVNNLDRATEEKLKTLSPGCANFSLGCDQGCSLAEPAAELLLPSAPSLYGVSAGLGQLAGELEATRLALERLQQQIRVIEQSQVPGSLTVQSSAEGELAIGNHIAKSANVMPCADIAKDSPG
jgi:voltage-gated sodium channel